MIVRRYLQTDQENVIRIWFDSTVAAHSSIPKEKWESHKADLQQKYLPMAETWVAEENGLLVGFISMLENYIGALFVDLPWQGKGVGTKLLDIDIVKSSKEKLSVGVYKKNQTAQRFYLRNSFRYLNEEKQKETGEIVINMIFP